MMRKVSAGALWATTERCSRQPIARRRAGRRAIDIARRMRPKPSPKIQPTDDVRLKYEAAVIGLGEAASKMLGSGVSEEHVARWAAAQRNALKQEYRDLTPTAVAARIAAKTLARYGSALGPSCDVSVGCSSVRDLGCCGYQDTAPQRRRTDEQP